MGMYDESSNESKFDSTLQSLRRLDQELIKCNHYSAQSDLNKDPRILSMWKQKILAAFREVYPKLKKEERNRINDIIKMYQKIKPCVVQDKTPEGTRQVLDLRAFSKYYSLNHRFELIVRLYATKHNMLIADKEPVDDSPD